jgi:hypothetical protein
VANPAAGKKGKRLSGLIDCYSGSFLMYKATTSNTIYTLVPCRKIVSKLIVSWNNLCTLLIVTRKCLFSQNLITYVFTGEELMDTPDSPAGADDQGDHGDPSILDRDDSQLDTERPLRVRDCDWSKPVSGASGSTFFSTETSAGKKLNQTSSTSSRTTTFSSSGTRPSMPPIYHTVNKLKQKQLVVRHLYGGGTGEVDCTTSGASASSTVQIWLFPQ